MAFAAAIAGTWAFVWFIQRIRFKDAVMVPLVGIMFSNVIGGVTSYLAYQYEMTQALTSWLVGHFSLVIKGRYEIVWLTAPLILLAFVSVFTGLQRVNRVLTLGVALGGTRRQQVLRCAGWHLGGALASAVLIFGLNGVSHLIYRLAYAPRGIVLDMDGLALLPTVEWLLILLAPVLLSICVAATVNTLGPKGYWVVWVLWMLICFSPKYLIELYEKSPAALWTLMAVLTVVPLGWTVWAVRRLLHWTVREL